MKHAKPLRLTALALALAAASFSAHALFGDDDARRAILDLRQRLDTAITAQNKLVEDNEQMRRSMLAPAPAGSCAGHGRPAAKNGIR